MVKRTTSSDASKLASLTIEEMNSGIKRLERRLTELNEYAPSEMASYEEITDAVTSLESSIDDALTRTFGSDTVEAHRYRHASHLRRWACSGSATVRHFGGFA